MSSSFIARPDASISSPAADTDCTVSSAGVRSQRAAARARGGGAAEGEGGEGTGAGSPSGFAVVESEVVEFCRGPGRDRSDEATCVLSDAVSRGAFAPGAGRADRWRAGHAATSCVISGRAAASGSGML
jgi:hypothetical protein